VLVTGFENEEPFWARGGGFFDFWTRRGFAPPSWLLVGTVEVVEVVASGVSEPEAFSGVATASSSFRFRLRIVLLETVAAFSPAIVVAMATALADSGVLRSQRVVLTTSIEMARKLINALSHASHETKRKSIDF
jgi:hypothetical protein